MYEAATVYRGIEGNRVCFCPKKFFKLVGGKIIHKHTTQDEKKVWEKECKVPTKFKEMVQVMVKGFWKGYM